MVGGVDFGLRYCGVGIVEEGALKDAALVRTLTPHTRGLKAWQGMAVPTYSWFEARGFSAKDPIYVEVMQVYQDTAAKVANDLLQLNGVAGVFGGLWPHGIEDRLPREWKGQIPKPVHHRRLRRFLKARPEQEAVLKKACRGVAESLQHNVLDGVLLAFYGAGVKI